MPEFIMDEAGEVNGKTFDDLDSFDQGYIEAMLFTNCTTGISMVDWLEPENQEDVREGRADGSIPTDAGYGDIYPDSLKQMLADCDAFKAKHLADLIAVESIVATPDRCDLKQAGRDFWYTRNGHGCGFWDGDWPTPFDDQFTDTAKTFGEVNADFMPDESSPTGWGYVIIE